MSLTKREVILIEKYYNWGRVDALLMIGKNIEEISDILNIPQMTVKLIIERKGKYTLSS